MWDIINEIKWSSTYTTRVAAPKLRWETSPAGPRLVWLPMAVFCQWTSQHGSVIRVIHVSSIFVCRYIHGAHRIPSAISKYDLNMWQTQEFDRCEDSSEDLSEADWLLDRAMTLWVKPQGFYHPRDTKIYQTMMHIKTKINNFQWQNLSKWWIMMVCSRIFHGFPSKKQMFKQPFSQLTSPPFGTPPTPSWRDGRPEQ